MPSLEWLPALTHVRLEVDGYNDHVPANIWVVSRTSRSLQSILIQIDELDEWCFYRAQVKEWAGVDSKVIIQAVPSDSYSIRDWEKRIARHGNNV